MNTTQTRSGRHNKTTLSLQEFGALESHVQEISEYISSLESMLIELAGEHDDEPTRMFLISAMKRLSEVSDIVIEPYWWHPQPEWTGGDSVDPKNTVWNEPHIVSALLK